MTLAALDAGYLAGLHVLRVEFDFPAFLTNSGSFVFFTESVVSVNLVVLDCDVDFCNRTLSSP